LPEGVGEANMSWIERRIDLKTKPHIQSETLINRPFEQTQVYDARADSDDSQPT
jgi:hypothetical protein